MFIPVGVLILLFFIAPELAIAIVVIGLCIAFWPAALVIAAIFWLIAAIFE
jgi:hypothetical protein